jgi:hypothetical protein
MEALILVADLGGPTMFVQIGSMKALHRDAVREFRSTAPDELTYPHGGRTSPEQEFPSYLLIGFSIEIGLKAIERRQGNRKKSFNVADLLAKTQFKKRPSFFVNARWRSASRAGL